MFLVNHLLCSGQSLSGTWGDDGFSKFSGDQLSHEEVPQAAGPLSLLGFPGDSAVKNLPANARDLRDGGSSPCSGRSPGEGNGNPH